jgi:hypothetical protein
MAGETEFLELEREKLDFERERHARDQWWQEDGLVNQRLTWLLTSQGVIGAGYAWLRHRIAEITVELAKKDADLKLLDAQKHYRQLLTELSDLLVALGFAVSLLILIGIGSAIWAQHVLQKQHYPRCRLYITRVTTIGGHLAALAFPLLCIITWWGISGVGLCFPCIFLTLELSSLYR